MKVLLAFGTRPEAIKMCPLAQALKKRAGIVPVVCVTGQHRHMLDQALHAFRVQPDYDLSLMTEHQTLFDVTSRVLEGIRPVLEKERPDWVLVQGDTATAFASALAAFYLRIPVGHVEAGLRTNDLCCPFPEEFNRQAISLLARYHFAPTSHARDNLIREGRPRDSIFVTGNPGIDALNITVKKDFSHPELAWAEGSRLLLLTAHRRESLGAPLRRMLRAVRRAVEEREDVKLLCPLHMNPDVRAIALEELGGCPRIRLIAPLDVEAFHNIMARCFLILTDSGGIQEEAPSLGKPVLVLRQATERPEGALGGGLHLAGTEEQAVYHALSSLLDDPSACRVTAANPFGDGLACERIADVLETGRCVPFEG